MADVPLTRAEYAEAIRSSLEQQGWGDWPDCAEQEAADLADLASGWSVGTVLERRLDELAVRALPNAFA